MHVNIHDMLRTWRRDSSAVGTFLHLQVMDEVVIGILGVHRAGLLICDILFVIAPSDYHAYRAVNLRNLMVKVTHG